MEQWAELRREHFVRKVSIKELARRTGLDVEGFRRIAAAMKRNGAVPEELQDVID